MESEVDYGKSMQGLSKKLSHDTQSSKMLRICEVEDLQRSCKIYGRSGMTVNGTLYLLPPLVHFTKGREFGSLPTPTASEHKYRLKGNSQQSKCLEAKARKGELSQMELLPTPTASSYGSNQGGAAGRKGKKRYSLESMAKMGLFATPVASDAMDVLGKNDTYKLTKNGTVRRYNQKGNNASLSLGRMVKFFPEGTLKASTLPTPSSGSLAPEFTELLMGFPAGWSELESKESSNWEML